MPMELIQMLERILVDPWFWAFLAAVGWGMGIAMMGTRVPGRRLGFGVVMFLLVELPRIVLPLPFVKQPRILPTSPWIVVPGILIIIGSLFFATPVFRIVPLTAPDRSEPLRTDGLYSIVRHPLMVCDLFWPLGWSLAFGSFIGMALTLVWLLMVRLLVQTEEEALVREYGDAYRAFQARVPSLIPRFPGSAGRRRPV